MKRRLLTLLLATLFVASQWSFSSEGMRGVEPRAAPIESVSSESVSVTQQDFLRGQLSGLTVIDGSLALQGRGQGLFVSSVIESPTPFTDLGTIWRGNVPNDSSVVIEARTSPDAAWWTDWRPVAADEDVQPRDGQPDTVVGSLLPVPHGESRHQYAQYRVTLAADHEGSPPSLRQIQAVFIDASQGPTTAAALQAASIEPFDLATQTTGKPPVVSRVAWGCPDGSGSLAWAPQYRITKALIVHHTVDSERTDYAARVRAIWQYHARTLGWGDIGYNYLVDPNGVIYEGRAGGDDVVAAHARQYNYGSMGVALLGNFEQAQPTGAAINSLRNLLAWKADQRGIDPRVMSAYFVDKNLPTLMGHRDALAGTACPGNNLQTLLPSLRQQVHQQVYYNGAAAQITSATFTPVTLQSGSHLQITVTLRNSGSVPLYSQGPISGYAYEESERASAGQYGRIRVAIGSSGPYGADYPYRWGFTDSLAPGATTTITGFIRLRSPGSFDYFARVSREQMLYLGGDVGRTAVRVTPVDITPPTSRVAPLPAFINYNSFAVHWSGQDNDGGSGLESFDVQYRVDSGPWVDWRTTTTHTSAVFGPVDPLPVETGRSYYFRSRARDRAGNIEAYPSGDGHANTTVDLIPPTSQVYTDTPTPSHAWFVLRWEGHDPQPGSGVRDYDVDVSDDGTTWRPWIRTFDGNAALFLGEPGAKYFFRVRARDRAGNLEPKARADLWVVAGTDPTGLETLFFPLVASTQRSVASQTGIDTLPFE